MEWLFVRIFWSCFVLGCFQGAFTLALKFPFRRSAVEGRMHCDILSFSIPQLRRHTAGVRHGEDLRADICGVLAHEKGSSKLTEY
jgi:hypothetical protein